MHLALGQNACLYGEPAAPWLKSKKMAVSKKAQLFDVSSSDLINRLSKPTVIDSKL